MHIDATHGGRCGTDRAVELRCRDLRLQRGWLLRCKRIESWVSDEVLELLVFCVAARVALVDRVLRPGQATFEVPCTQFTFQAHHHVFGLGDGVAFAQATGMAECRWHKPLHC